MKHRHPKAWGKPGPKKDHNEIIAKIGTHSAQVILIDRPMALGPILYKKKGMGSYHGVKWESGIIDEIREWGVMICMM